MLTTVQPLCSARSRACFGAPDVVELAVGVVVQDEQPEERFVGVPGEVQHLDVAVGVPGGEHSPPSGLSGHG